jgi:hypothetical protein
LIFASLLVVVSGSGCGSNDQSVRPISAQLSISIGDLARVTAHHTLRCHPHGGDMPLRAVLCSLIDAHPVAMLHPPRAESGCDHVSPWIRVDGFAAGKRVFLQGAPACEWPGGEALFAYWAAAEYPRALPAAEIRLHCDEDPVLLRQPIQWARVRACLHDVPPG